jgi:hypothetical protein
MGKYSGRRTAAEFVGGFLKGRGFDLDPRRLDEGLAAQRDRAKAEFAQYSDRLRAAATVAKRARRQVEIEEFAWRNSPSAENLQRAKNAQLALKQAETDLLEECLGDRAMFRRLLEG